MEAYNDWRLVTLSPWPTWALGLLGLLAVGGVLLAARGLRKEPRRWRRASLLALRSISMLAALFVVLEPGVRLLQTARVRSRLAVLVDGSASMQFPTEAKGASRSAEAAAWLSAVSPKLAGLEHDYSLEYYELGESLTPIEAEAARTGLEARAEKTDLLGALRSLAGGAGSGRKLAGAVVVSDGADNAELAGGVNGASRKALEALKIPVSTVAVVSGTVKDLSIESVHVEDFAFVRNTVEVEATIVASGMGEVEVPVTLRREGQVVSQQTVRLRPDETRYSVKLSFVPEEIGEFVFTVSAPVFEGEAVESNNARSFVLKVIRDRVRALLVVGRPSWDQRFLRTLLKNDPNVDLISFFILRTAQDQPKAGEAELSLIPFPVQEIFDRQLKSFDLVIFQNFAYRPYRMDAYLPNIRRYVEEGGAFVMIGGENSFGEGGYDQSPLGDILPVEPAGTAPVEALFPPRLTEAGLRHPITRLAAGAEANQSAWEKLPQLPGINVTRAKPGARVLLDHPHLPVGNENAPVLVVSEVGKGRVMALTTDSSWFWSLVASGEGGGTSRAYERLWSNAIRWLVRDPELTPVQVQAAQRSVEPGQPVVATITVRRSDYGPAADAEVDVSVVDAESGRLVHQEHLASGTDGTARFEVASPGPGAYKLLARASLGGAPLGSGEDVVAVRATSVERSEVRPRPALLRAIAEATGGGFIESSARELPDLALAPPDVVEIGRAQDRPIWDRFWPLAILAVCLGSEWVLRRRWGYF
ncbi:glutamine amidotransferase [Vulgatibacter incomptus]|uniref:Threonine dehydrogenase n=1 Tax=Vulgatibacter incomptus TaxID=1391653 RepID=A0A0K1PD85_9BACT|nr:glutamine amidotransferase [Vulgatibacter incomptus]AKU91462.1 Threonine dehydrogenase [Vulgatibacter incomptus]